MKPALRRSLWVLAPLLVLLVVLGLFWFRNPPSAFPPLPQPNGYHALARTSARLGRLPANTNGRELTTNQLAEALERNADLLVELRQSLALPAVVPVQMSDKWFSTHSTELVNLKGAVQLLNAEADLKMHRGDTNGALLAALDALRLSNTIQHGGVLIDALVGAACEAGAVRRLTNAMAGLTASECRQALAALERHDQERDTSATLQAREAEWSRKSYGTLRRIQSMISSRSLRPEIAAVAKGLNSHNNVTRETRRALLNLAIRTYTLEHGSPPAKISDLVPAYLSLPPSDPSTQLPLELR